MFFPISFWRITVPRGLIQPGKLDGAFVFLVTDILTVHVIKSS